ncbi:MAG: ATP-binding cassette domain-containing protein [bacterium]|nr:ATP-binding cassette domain-containing protein [bacterium]
MNQTVCISIRDLCKRYKKFAVLNHITLEVNTGERILISGNNGSGKSTLLRCISQLESYENGVIRIGNNSFSPNCTTHIKNVFYQQRILGFVMQQDAVWPHLSTKENISVPLHYVIGLSKKEANRRAMKLIDQASLLHKQNDLAETLSGGEKRRLSIIRTLALKPEILLLDEITANLDKTSIVKIRTLLSTLPTNITMIAVSHQPEDLSSIITRHLCMKSGEISELPYQAPEEANSPSYT